MNNLIDSPRATRPPFNQHSPGAQDKLQQHNASLLTSLGMGSGRE